MMINVYEMTVSDEITYHVTVLQVREIIMFSVIEYS